MVILYFQYKLLSDRHAKQNLCFKWKVRSVCREGQGSRPNPDSLTADKGRKQLFGIKL